MDLGGDLCAGYRRVVQKPGGPALTVLPEQSGVGAACGGANRLTLIRNAVAEFFCQSL